MNDDYDSRGYGNKVDTEPNMVCLDLDSNRDFFKKPLKLLKKKINEQKKKNAGNVSASFTN